MYIYRNITSNVVDLIHHFPVVGIIGPRQVGKTTLVKELIDHIDKECIYLDLELPEDFSKLSDPQIYLEQHEDKCVIQVFYTIWPELMILKHCMVIHL